MDQKEFIHLANIKHSYKYDYSKTVFKDLDIEIVVICPIHGEFQQKPKHHLKNNGCRKCSIDCLTNKNFIETSKKTHLNKYDYSLVEYKNNITPVKIICPVHGVFNQKPANHLRGKGCPKCGIIRSNNKKNLKIDDFIDRSNKIHGNKYDYSLVKIINTYSLVEIICPNHGIFNQSPDNHMHGCGCPSCKETKGEKKIRSFLTKNNINYIYQYRIDGCRNKNKLSFDFAVFNKTKLTALIEYDGEQHFKPIKFYGGLRNFLIVKKRDFIKNKYCKKNKIPLLRIRYNNINIIDDILIKYFKDGNR